MVLARMFALISSNLYASQKNSQKEGIKFRNLISDHEIFVAETELFDYQFDMARHL